MSASRRLFVLAVRDYPEAHNSGFADGIDDQLAVVNDWWSAAELKERALTKTELRPIRNRRDVENAVDEAGLRNLTEHDVAVLYITGHGMAGRSGHFLHLPETPRGQHVAQGYPTREILGAVLGSHAKHLLVIANSCFAGTLAKEIETLREDLPHRRLDSIELFFSGDFDEMPQVREFAGILAEVHRYLRSDQAGYATDCLSFDQFAAELYGAHRRLAKTQPGLPEPIRFMWPKLASPDPSPCLPNPGYRPAPRVVDAARAQVSTPADELDYWLDRASGRTSTDDPGWYFSGRRELTTRVADFLRDGQGLLIVTGAAGTGKSAIIARAVTLSDPDFRSNPRHDKAMRGAPAETVPPVRSVAAAVLARNKSVTDVAEQLIRALGATPASTTAPETRMADLRAQLLGLVEGGKTLVLDGLDEATDPTRLITDLLGPLLRATAADPRFRLIVGVRSAVPESDGPAPGHDLLDLVSGFSLHCTELRTDNDTLSDLTEYLTSLVADHYQGYEAERDRLITELARTIAPSFLDARFAGQRLRESDPLITGDVGLHDLQQGTVGLLRADLTDTATSEHPATALLAGLRATAFALGTGVPFANIWPAVATAVLDAPVPDTTIEYLLHSRLGGYLARGTADARVVFRPVHESLAETLRDHPELFLGAPDAH
ncbi:ATP-binding protein [Saccharopolyspora sp. ID03-671]|uniref:AAA family ATPase n=1 Tax=Saccharopolyspora sp. ID03-671 TaxID=3073066 RepID=UPI003248E808